MGHLLGTTTLAGLTTTTLNALSSFIDNTERVLTNAAVERLLEKQPQWLGRLVFVHGIRSHGGWYGRSCAAFAAAGFDGWYSIEEASRTGEDGLP